MDNEITINQLPPSYQHSYGRRKEGGVYLKSEAKAFRNEVGWLFKKYFKKPLKGEFGVEIFFEFSDNRRRDLDNLLKHILDGGTGVVWEDDKQITEIHIFKNKGRKPKTTICVWKIE